MSAVPETGTTPGTNAFRRVGVQATRKATVIAFFAWLFAVFDYIMFGTLLPQIASSFGWTDATASLVSTLVSVGTAIIALAVGPIVDRIGRRKGMILTVSGTAVASALSAATPGAGYLIGVRSLGGLGLLFTPTAMLRPRRAARRCECALPRSQSETRGSSWR